MCLTISEDNLKLKTAKKNIIVYKVVRRVYNEYGNKKMNTVKSSIYKHIYEKNAINPTINIIPHKLYSIKKDKFSLLEINSAYHFYTKNSIRFVNLSTRNVAIFMIPKGASYYINKKTKIGVSSNIIFKKIIPNKNLNIIKSKFNNKDLKQIKI